jgi:hypothetical protein
MKFARLRHELAAGASNQFAEKSSGLPARPRVGTSSCVDARFGDEYDSYGVPRGLRAFVCDRERDLELELIDWRAPRLTAKTSDEIVALARKRLQRTGLWTPPANNRQSGLVQVPRLPVVRGMSRRTGTTTRGQSK